MRDILKHLKKKDWILIGIAFLLILFQIKLDLSIPEYMSSITKLVESQNGGVDTIGKIGRSMLWASLGSVLAAVIVGYIASTIGASLGNTLRNEMYNSVSDYTAQEMNKFSVASLITRTTTDVSQVQLFIAAGLQIFIKSPILAFAAITKIMGQNWQWSLLMLGAILFLLSIILVIVFLAVPKFNRVQILTDNINRIMRESLTGIRVVRAYNAESYQEDKFKDASNELAENNLFATRILGFLQPSLNIAMSVTSLGIYWIGAWLITTATVSMQIEIFSNMVVYSAYALQIIAAFMLFSILLVLMPRAKVSASRINEVLSTKSSMQDGTYEPNVVTGELEFKNVSFMYPDSHIHTLENISFTAKPGQTVAIIGATGSGKTTLINLIPRTFDVTKGEVLLDGKNVKEYKKDVLYDSIGYVSQKATLFSGTIESNVNFGYKKNHKVEQHVLNQAIEISQSKEFVNKSDLGIDAPVAQLGTNLSGGQKQRVSIARAVARDPKIMIFDDSFSALDFKTDKSIRNALDAQFKDVTRIIVAQRIGTILDADQILVLDQGRLVGKGTHNSLMQDCLVYQDIAKSQLSQEELENGQ